MLTTHNEADRHQEQPVFLDPGALVGLRRLLPLLPVSTLAVRPLRLILPLPLHLAMYKGEKFSSPGSASGSD